jgi:acyl-CoA synthetase (AMP-forming)/AMP-acid ligase II
MVKLYGIRVEPEAVESAFLSCPGIRQAAVKVLGEGSEARLWAWYSTSASVEEPALRRHLSQRLPNYMIPSFLVRMKELPLNQSGKLDWGALTQIPD